MLLVSELTKDYGRHRALDAVSADFPSGVHALLAPNGAGKSTLIKVLTTLIRPSGGEVLYDGVDIATMGADYRNVIGYLPQDFGYYPGYTARRFLRYIAVLKGLDRRTVDDRIDELLELVALTGSADTKLKTFSGGMRQRVGIAQALLNDPRIVVLDEPTAGLDPKERARFRNLVSQISRDRVVILSTHIVSDIETIADSVLMLRQGHLVAHDTPDEIRAGLIGRVFETDDPREVREGDLLVAERRDAGAAVYRYVAAPDSVGGGRPVAANLEDVFLVTFQDVA